MTDSESVSSGTNFLERRARERWLSETECHEEHLRLADYVKGVHADLRKKFKSSSGEGDLERIWIEHCGNKTVLSQYADAMHTLATEHWTKNQETRIDWCREVTHEYFMKGGLQKVLDKEKRKLQHEETKRKAAALKTETSASSDETKNTDDEAITEYRVSKNDSEDLSISLQQLSHKSETFVSDVDQKLIPGQLSNIHETLFRNIDPNGTAEASLKSSLIDSEDAVLPGSQARDGYALDASSCMDNTTFAAGTLGDVIPQKYSCSRVTLPVEGKIRLLDVGSCFNPFLVFPEFQAVGIDISPATESVFYCDFLHLRTTKPLQVANDTMSSFINNLRDPVDWLPEESFHVIVFSLLLEYFPAPYQRWLCCEKAWSLLMYNGILIIVTPDSHKQHRNAAMIKSWKIAIESIGFKRWRYLKKEHLHCMAFRKVAITSEEKQQKFLNGITPEMIYIPQDFHNNMEDSGHSFAGYGVENEDFYRNHVMTELPLILSESDGDDDDDDDGEDDGDIN